MKPFGLQRGIVGSTAKHLANSEYYKRQINRYEEDIAKLIGEGTVTRKEGLLNADSPTNLMWRLENDFTGAQTLPKVPVADPDDHPSFTEITLDVRH